MLAFSYIGPHPSQFINAEGDTRQALSPRDTLTARKRDFLSLEPKGMVGASPVGFGGSLAFDNLKGDTQ